MGRFGKVGTELQPTVGATCHPRSVTDHERTALTLAATHYRHPAVRETHALEQLGLTPTRYWALVDRLLDRADVEMEMPAEVRRLRRVREAREQRRSSRRQS